MTSTVARSPRTGEDRILTVPNLISFARLLAVPVFGYLVVIGDDVAALVVLVAASASDFVDGYLARALGQVTRLGVMLDPVADRAYVIVALFTLAWRDLFPWPLVAVLVVRDVVLALNLVALRRSGLAPLPVHDLGKVATFVLFCGFPLLLLATALEGSQSWVLPLAWAVLLWGAGLYWWAGAGYLLQGHRMRAGVAATRRAPPS